VALPVADSGIAARAFELLELHPLSSLGEGSQRAVQADAALTDARHLCLSSNDWSDASRLTTLPREASAPAVVLDGRDAAYRLPPECLVVREVSDGGRGLPWVKSGRQIVAPASPALTVRYTADVPREAELSAHLRLAIAVQMAVLMSDLHTTSTSKKQELRDQLQEALAAARRFDRGAASGQRYDGRDDQPDWIDAALT
jgi:hypothetical protein